MVTVLPEKLKVTTATLGAVGILTFALRCYVRIRLVKIWGLDDTFISLAFVCNMSNCSCPIAILTGPDPLGRTHVVHHNTTHGDSLWKWQAYG
jgi:hypothetical protein